MAIVGLGTDIVDIRRFDRHTPASPALAERILNATELTEYQAHRAPERFLAKRFALKEAAVKALGTGVANGVSMQDVWVTHTELGQPLLQYNGRFAELATALGVTNAHVSISDERDYATATVILSSD
jgi:holo-[acyl-carrier protein] synthase